MNNLDTSKRLLIAIALSFVFLMVYDYFIMPKQNSVAEQNQTKSSNQSVTTATNAISTETKPAIDTQKAPMSEQNSKILVKIESKNFDIEIDYLGRINQYYLKSHKYLDQNGEFTKLFDQNYPKPLEIRFSNEKINQEAFEKSYVSNISHLKIENEPITLSIKQILSELEVEKVITFYPNGRYSMNINLSKNEKYFVSPGFRPSATIDSFTFHGVLIKEADDTITMIDDGDAKANVSYIGTKIASATDRYYTTSMYNLTGGYKALISKDTQDNPIIFIENSTANDKYDGYIGPKEYELLNNIHHELTSIVEYGFFTFIAKPLFAFLNYIFMYVGNWGWAIVLLTIFVRIILYPLTYKGMVSMNKLKELAPKMKELQQKYKGDPQKLNMHMLELYKKNNANPMGGCLPLLLQIPIFFAIYRVLLNAVELKDSEWIFWINDLSEMDPYFILPIIMGGTMFIQQLITPTNFTDPLQEKLFKYLPVVFTFFFVTFPAGLVLYWIVNNIASIAQQYFINKMFEKKKLEQKLKH
ncbi:MAG: membrane protein insertase YidC [Campylobacterales bacterium]|nr:membrane protein insertase YidC [Campylobacterales bacterium]